MVINKKFVYVLLSVLLGVFLVGVVSAYDNSCSGRLQWMQDAINTEISSIKDWQETDLTLDSLETPLNSWFLKGNAGTSFVLTENDSKVGTYSGNYTYNVSNPTFDNIRKNINGTLTNEGNFTNYTGIGFWYKGDGTRNQIYTIQFADESLKTYTEDKITFNLNETSWNYAYIDFSHFYNNSNTSQWINYEQLKNVTRILIFVKAGGGSGVTRAHSSFLIDDIEIIDNDKGSMYLPRTKEKTDVGSNARYQEGIYNLAWMYNHGGTGYTNNETILNKSIDAGDWLVRNQWTDGAWSESLGAAPNRPNPATNGFTGTSLALAYKELSSNSRMNENITIYHQGNITTRSRGELWRDTIERAANFTYLHFPYYTPPFYGNQHLSALTTEYLWYNISGNVAYLNDFNNNINTLNNSYYNYNFSFIFEANSTTNLGFSAGYDKPVGLQTMAYLWNISQNNVLYNMFNDSANGIVNVYANYTKVHLPNSSRGDVNGTASRGLFAIYSLNNKYAKQYIYNSYNRNWNTTIGYGLYTYPNQSSENEFRATTLSVIDYTLCTVPVTQGIKFPMEYISKSYYLLNNSLDYEAKVLDYRPQEIENRTGTQFPIFFYAYDSSTVGWIKDSKITNEDPVNTLTINTPYLGTSRSISNGTLISGTVITNTDANLTIPVGGSIYVN